MANELYNVQLIDPYMIKKILPEIPTSVDDSLIDSSILEVQETFLYPVLGDTFYQEILSEHSGGTLTTENQYLYNRFLVKILSKRSVIRLIYLSTYQFENSGIRIKDGTDQSRAAELSELTTLKHIYEEDADRITQSMVLYINENIDNYPSFLTSTYCTARSNRTMYSRLPIGGF